MAWRRRDLPAEAIAADTTPAAPRPDEPLRPGPVPPPQAAGLDELRAEDMRKQMRSLLETPVKETVWLQAMPHGVWVPTRANDYLQALASTLGEQDQAVIELREQLEDRANGRGGAEVQLALGRPPVAVAAADAAGTGSGAGTGQTPARQALREPRRRRWPLLVLGVLLLVMSGTTLLLGLAIGLYVTPAADPVAPRLAWSLEEDASRVLPGLLSPPAAAPAARTEGAAASAEARVAEPLPPAAMPLPPIPTAGPALWPAPAVIGPPAGLPPVPMPSSSTATAAPAALPLPPAAAPPAADATPAQRGWQQPDRHTWRLN